MTKVFLTILILGVASCTHVVVYSPTGLMPADFWKEQATRRHELRMLSAKLRLAYRGKRGSASGQGRIVLQEGSQIRLEMRDPFGRVHYVVVLDGVNFTAYYPRQNMAYLDDRAGKGYVAEFLGLDFSFADLQNVLLGLLPDKVKKADLKEWKWDGGLGQYEGVFRQGDDEISCFVDATQAHLRSIRLKSPSRQVEIRYDDFERCCDGRESPVNLRVAMGVQVSLDKKEMALGLDWEQLRTLETPRPESAFRVSLEPGTKKVFLK